MNLRKEVIEKMVFRGMTYAKISSLLNISKQRVHQIYTGYKSPASKPKPKKHLPPIEVESLVIPKGQIGKITGISNGSRDRLRELIRIRDKHTCQICLRVWKKGNRRFDVHHMDEDKEGKSKERGTTTLDRNTTNRMITLCHKCHLNLDTVRNKMSSKVYAQGS